MLSSRAAFSIAAITCRKFKVVVLSPVKLSAKLELGGASLILVAKLKTKTDFSLTEELSLELRKESSKNANPPTPRDENTNNPNKVPKQLAKVCLKNCPIGFHLLLIFLFPIVGIPRPETTFLSDCLTHLGESPTG
jgi:hypothetical protein